MALTGDLDSRAAPYFRAKLAELVAANPNGITLDLSGLNNLSKAALRAIDFERGKLAADGRCVIEGASDAIKAQLNAAELSEEIVIA
jgi:anti-anti-sigma regulatory factor